MAEDDARSGDWRRGRTHDLDKSFFDVFVGYDGAGTDDHDRPRDSLGQQTRLKFIVKE